MAQRPRPLQRVTTNNNNTMKKRIIISAAAAAFLLAGGFYAHSVGTEIRITCVPGNADYEAGTGLCNAKNRAADDTAKRRAADRKATQERIQAMKATETPSSQGWAEKGDRLVSEGNYSAAYAAYISRCDDSSVPMDDRMVGCGAAHDLRMEAKRHGIDTSGW